jgi:hypothetical protein
MTMNRIFVSLYWFGGIVLPPASRSGMPEIDNESYAYFGDRTLVYRLAYSDDIVAFKMGRRQGGPSRTGS